MKLRYILPIFLVIAAIFDIKAQVSEDNRSMSLGIQNAMILDLPGTNYKLADKLWKKFIKPYGGKVKKQRKMDEWFSDDAEITDIGGSNTIDIYARAQEAGDDTELILWIDLGGAWLSSAEHPNRAVEAEKLLLRFALYVAKEQTNIELDAEEKKLKQLQSNLKKLQKDNDRYHREIEAAKDKIAKAEANIRDNEIEQNETVQTIEMQQEAIEAVKRKLAEL